MTVRHKCSGKTPDMNGMPNVLPCLRSGTVECDGQWYCWQHSPYNRRARNAKLAALVTVGVAELLEYLAEGIDCLAPTEQNVSTPTKTDDARELAARIREALGLKATE